MLLFVSCTYYLPTFVNCPTSSYMYNITPLHHPSSWLFSDFHLFNCFLKIYLVYIIYFTQIISKITIYFPLYPSQIYIPVSYLPILYYFSLHFLSDTFLWTSITRGWLLACFLISVYTKRMKYFTMMTSPHRKGVLFPLWFHGFQVSWYLD